MLIKSLFLFKNLLVGLFLLTILHGCNKGPDFNDQRTDFENGQNIAWQRDNTNTCSISGNLELQSFGFNVYRELQVAKGKKFYVTYSLEGNKLIDHLDEVNYQNNKFVSSVLTSPLIPAGQGNNPSYAGTRSAIRAALNEVSKHVPICFVEIKGQSQKAMLRFHYLSSGGTVLGLGKLDLVELIPGQGLTPGVAIHEILHSLGLGHNLAKSSIMYPGVLGIVKPSNNDIKDLQELYGPGSCNANYESTPSNVFPFIQATVTEVGSDFAKLEWTKVGLSNKDVLSKPNSYKIEYQESGSSAKQVLDINGNSTLTMLNALKSGQRYSGKIYAEIELDLTPEWKNNYFRLSELKTKSDNPFFPTLIKQGSSLVLDWISYPGLCVSVSKTVPIPLGKDIPTKGDNETPLGKFCHGGEPLTLPQSAIAENEYVVLKLTQPTKKFASEEFSFTTTSKQSGTNMGIRTLANDIQHFTNLTSIDHIENKIIIASQNLSEGSSLKVWSGKNQDLKMNASNTIFNRDYPLYNIIGIDHISSTNSGEAFIVAANSDKSCLLEVFLVKSSGQFEIRRISSRTYQNLCSRPKLNSAVDGKKILSWHVVNEPTIFAYLISSQFNSNDLDVVQQYGIEGTYNVKIKTILDHAISTNFGYTYLTISFKDEKDQYRLMRMMILKWQGSYASKNLLQLLAINGAYPYYLSSRVDEAGKGAVIFGSQAMPSNQYGLVTTIQTNSETKPLNAFLLTQNVQIFTANLPFFDVANDGSIVNFDEFRINVLDAASGSIASQFEIQSKLASISDFLGYTDGVRVAGTSSTGLGYVICNVKSNFCKTKSYTTTEMAGSANARFVKSSSNKILLGIRQVIDGHLTLSLMGE